MSVFSPVRVGDGRLRRYDWNPVTRTEFGGETPVRCVRCQSFLIHEYSRKVHEYPSITLKTLQETMLATSTLGLTAFMALNMGELVEGWIT